MVDKKKNMTFNREENTELIEHMDEVLNSKMEHPDIIMHHERDESYRIDIHVPEFSISEGGKILFDDAMLQISYGKRYVLVGRNGIGKSTLLHHIADKEIDGIPEHLQILHVQQESVANDTGLLDEILLCDKERAKLLKENEELEKKLDDKKYSDKEIKAMTDRLLEVSNRLQEIGVDDAVVNATDILIGLGFSNEDLTKATKLFSGGWRMRISLAKALFVQPDILLLDEPTNHLDMNAVLWLEDYLVEWPYTLVIVSHARDFINQVATDVMHVENKKLIYYKGNYNDFEKAREERIRHVRKAKEKQDKEIAHMTEFINQFRANKARSSLVQSRIKVLEKMERIEDIIEDPVLEFTFPNPVVINPPLFELHNVDLGYSKEKPILEEINFHIDMDSRYAIVGPNGAGKTTFLKAIMGELEELCGKVTRNTKLKLAMFTQHHVDQLNLEFTPIQQISSMYKDVSYEGIRAHLSSFGITGNLATRPNFLLSGGEKTRVALAGIVYENPQIILMDEPTNHLDIDAIDALAEALNYFEGGIIIVSHDRHFVEEVCDKIYIVDEGKVELFPGNFTEYKKKLNSGK